MIALRGLEDAERQTVLLSAAVPDKRAHGGAYRKPHGRAHGGAD
jgi:hypothetical protein